MPRQSRRPDAIEEWWHGTLRELLVGRPSEGLTIGMVGATIDGMVTQQITVRIPVEDVEFLDALVESREVRSRADGVHAAIAERRRQVDAQHEIAIFEAERREKGTTYSELDEFNQAANSRMPGVWADLD